MKAIMILSLSLFSTLAFAERGPYFPSPEKAPVKHGKVIFNSPELTQINHSIYIGEVVIQKNNGGFEVGPMIYKCTFNDDDGAYGSLGCRYERYEMKKAKAYQSCEISDSEYYYCE
jgi:hypothetical protein